MATSTPEVKQETETLVVDKKRDNQLAADRLKLKEHTTVEHTVTVEVGTVVEDLLRPEFWAHVAAGLRPYSEITVRTDDGAWWARVLVMTVSRAFARVKILQHVPLLTSDVDQTQDFQMEGHTIKWRGEHLQWAVVRLKDGSVVRENLESKKAARMWLEDYVSAPLA
jgi:hypothetical protein